MENAAIAERLEAFAALLDLAGSGPYTSRAYRRAAETIRETKAPIEDLVRAGRVQALRGIGPGIAARLHELVETGRIAELDQLESEVQPQLVGLGRLLGLGPKRMVDIAGALSGPGVRLAVDAGVPVVASTDAHSVRGPANMQLAVATARRGWATASDVLNTRPLADFAHRRR